MKLRHIVQTTVALACLLPLLSSPALAQDPLHANPLDVGVPSPTAASIANAALADVSHETGALQLSIPLFEVTTRSGLRVPITLEYSSTGVKVDELAGWVGMGWTLKAGGAVIRTVRGLPDESIDKGYPYTRHRLYNDVVWHGDFETGYHLAPIKQLIEDLYDGLIDTQPDLFVFNAPGLSGRFVWVGPNEFSLVPHQAITIADQGGGLVNMWRMTGPDGTRYTFGTPVGDDPIEETRSDQLEASWETAAWYLTKMEAVNGEDAITFEYERNVAQAAHGVYHEDVVVIGAPYCDPLGGNKESIQNTTTRAPVLHSIVSEDMEVLFHTSLQENDLDVTHAPASVLTHNQIKLDAIEVFHRGVLVRRFDLDYEMYTGTTNHISRGPINVSKRMFLMGLRESGAGGLQLPPYLFEYDNPAFLPARLSYSQDHWGYYNASGNTSLLPPADREPNGVYARLGTLTRVTYPTGGFEVFQWGGGDRRFGNNNVPSGGVRVEKRLTYAGPTAEAIVREYRYRSEDGEGLSSGIAGEAVYTQEFSTPAGGITCSGTVRTAHSQVTLGLGGGTSYSQVAVLEGEDGAFGRTVYRYHVDQDATDVGYGGVPGAVTNWEWRSALIEERVFDADGHLIVQRKHAPAQVVELPGANHHEWRALAARIHFIQAEELIAKHIVLFFRQYHVISGWPRLLETTEYRY